MKLHWLLAMIAVSVAFTASAAMAAKIVVENEHARAITKSMTLMTDTTASGGKVIGVPVRRPHAATETGPADTGHADYKVKVAADGTYQFWGRCWWYDACGNSFFVAADSTSITARTPYVTDQTIRRWHWVAGPSLHLTKGVHTIRVQYREDGAKMDQFLLTTTPRNRWEPSRVERETPQFMAP